MKSNTTKNHSIRITLYDYAYESFSIQYLTSTLKMHGFPTEVYYDCSLDKDYLGQDFFLTSLFSLSPKQIAERILATEPDVVGFSVLTVYFPILAKIMQNLKELKPDIIILGGGPHCILAPRQTLENQNLDFIFLGDADISLPAFLIELESHPVDEIKSFPAERLPGVSNMYQGKMIDRGIGPLIKDLDAVPFPEKDAYYKKNSALKIMYTASCSRGCVFTCTYCNSNNLRKIYKEYGQTYFRLRSVSNVIKELRLARSKYNPRYIMFLDNFFAPNSRWLREFAAFYKKEIGLPFFCETNPNVHTVETLDMLADAGCTLLQFGFQSANEQVRREILHRRETNEHIRRLVKHAKELGMLVCVDHIANLPGEKKEHLEEAVEFYRELRPYWVNLGFLQYYPKADIINIALACKALNEEDLEAIYSGKSQSSFRLLSKSRLGFYYRTLPMRLFSGFKMPSWLGGWMISLIDNRYVARLLSPLASSFIYLSRILSAFTLKHDFLVRHHVIRNLYVMRVVFKEKYFYNGR